MLNLIWKNLLCRFGVHFWNHMTHELFEFNGYAYNRSKACGFCHEIEYLIWHKGRSSWRNNWIQEAVESEKRR